MSNQTKEPPLTITDGIGRWLINGERGISSNAIVQHLTGNPPGTDWESHPRDPSDLMRCFKLVTLCPEIRPHLPRMAEVSDVWGRVAERWDELTELMLSEWGSGKCPKTYDRMKQLGC
jgi:hypothetical protein